MEYSTIALMFIVHYMMKPLEFVPMEMSESVNCLHSNDSYVTLYHDIPGMISFVLFTISCPYLHRNGGDTERRYHLRYYKTSTCVYETDSRGFCVKNGPHCAFAHGPNDLRQAVYDARELQGDDDNKVPLFSNLEKDKGVLIDDPRWQGLCMNSTVGN